MTTVSAVSAALNEGLFVAILHSDYIPDGHCGTARHAAFAELKAYGVGGCASRVAGEFGSYPVEAAARMAEATHTLAGAR